MADLLVKLYDLPDIAPLVKVLAAQGVVIRRAMAYEKHQVLAWVRECFAEGWASECDVAFSNRPISCFLATERGKIIGFACYESTSLNFFGPTGVAEENRGRGVGKALLLSSLHAMAEKGYGYAIIGHASDPQYYVKALGAIPIEGSSPGIYRDFLKEK
ncbi:MAG: GNAT family N-acetyltransferase [Bdellovibrionales bacterium]|nr:GNAT family N-acetyltransferase [Bdellovibrionales bacterium]